MAVAFVALWFVRQASLVLGSTKPAANTSKSKREEKPMVTARSSIAAVLETTWALGVSVLAGPLLA
jgi:hypothetical protein